MSRKVINILITILLLIIVSIPFTVLIREDVSAISTSDEVTSYDDDYVFFVVDEGQTPLAAIPAQQSSPYLWTIVITTLLVFMVFTYSSWYLSIRKNLWELSGKLPSVERNALKVPNGFFHPLRSYRLCKEAEHSVASVYSNLYY